MTLGLRTFGLRTFDTWPNDNLHYDTWPNGIWSNDTWPNGFGLVVLGQVALGLMTFGK